jgi:protein TonB
MSTQHSPLSTNAGFTSSEVLNVLYRGPRPVTREKADFPRRTEKMKNDSKTMGPDAIWGQYNNYRSNGLMGSVVVHIILLGLILFATFSPRAVQLVKPHETVTLIAPSPDSYAMPVAKKIVAGGGGGGTREKLPAPKAALPKPAMQQITPPAMVVRNEQPKLAVAPTVVVPPQVRMADNHMPNLGDPQAPALPSMPSNGTGAGGGIGSGSGGGVGVGHGSGVGAGSGGGIGGGVFKVGGGISAPTAVNTPDPEYTEEARIAKTQGKCILWLIVDETGKPRNIKVVRGLGYGLDAKAVEAVQQWRFQPALKDGKPVNVQISVEVGFHLY